MWLQNERLYCMGVIVGIVTKSMQDAEERDVVAGGVK